jgi:hypothetical protein
MRLLSPVRDWWADWKRRFKESQAVWDREYEAKRATRFDAERQRLGIRRMITQEQAIDAARREWESQGLEWPEHTYVDERTDEFVVVLDSGIPQTRITVAVQDGSVTGIHSPEY